jgi:hypothetical protein
MVSIVPRPSGAFHVVVTDSARGAQEIRCDRVATSCGSIGGASNVASVQLEKTEGSVTVRVTDAANRFVTVRVEPEYESLYPNGRQCGPACRVAQIRVRWPY